jgi:hypothetical protein
MSRWFRVYDNLVEDPKVQRLSDSLFRGLVNLWCLTSQGDGLLPTIGDIAFKLRIKPAQAQKLLSDLRNAGLIVDDETGTHPHNWNGRQFKSDVSNERVKRHRERKCNVTEAVTETPPEAEQIQNRAEAEQTRASVTNSEKVLRTDLMEAFGPSRTPDLSRTGVWLSKGYSHTMILEVVKELLARKPDISTLNYFDAALAERYIHRPESPSEKIEAAAKIDMDSVVAMFVKTGIWSKYAGNEPGMGGCRCPPEILVKHGIDPKTGMRMQ